MFTDYRKKPVVIQAEAWMGTTGQYERLSEAGIITKEVFEDGSAVIPTLEGLMRVDLNDYIIRGVKNEYYPCKPDIFELTYEKV